MHSHVTTKGGDRGETGSLGGDRYSKSHVIMECCGKVDALRAETALCRILMLESGRSDAEALAAQLLWILHTYFLIGAQCNDPLDKHPEYRKEDLAARHLERLEAYQAELEARTPLGRTFIAGASNALSARLDIACTSARTLEREIVRLKEQVPSFNSEHIVAFVNRLSDFLFVLARCVEDGEHLEVNYDCLEQGD